MVELRKIDSENLWDAVKLTVEEAQKPFVAANADSLLTAYASALAGRTAVPYGVYDGDTMVGFVMLAFGWLGGGDDPPIAADSYCFWRFMIDKRYQGRGYGRQALRASLDYMRTRPWGPAEYCWLTYVAGNEAAAALYRSEGFRETGETIGKELVCVLKL